MFSCMAARAKFWLTGVIRAAAGRRTRRLAGRMRWLQRRSPAVADIIGARRVWTVVMISSGSIPWR
jgi:hypothetical protein